jgi:hypothetical protein
MKNITAGERFPAPALDDPHHFFSEESKECHQRYDCSMGDDAVLHSSDTQQEDNSSPLVRRRALIW